MSVMRLKGSWVEGATADNAAATASRAAPAGGVRHFITSVSASFSASQSTKKLLELRYGSTVVASWYVADEVVLSFSSPIELPPGQVANLVLAASGTGGQVGAVVLTGHTL